MSVKWMYIGFLLTCTYSNVKASQVPSRQITFACDSQIYCQGDLLKTVQVSKIFNDSKTFVDMSMKRPAADILKRFKKFMKNTGNNPTSTQVQHFVQRNFVSDAEVEKWIPPDFRPKPAFLSKIINPTVAEFARRIVFIWRDLGRKVKKEVFQNPELHSLIAMPNGFIIPGGRFSEYYYWDYYWIVEGLILCEMVNTVRGVLDNFISIVKKYGYVPNGGRIYYIGRSQPPMLTFMAKNYFDTSRNLTWLRNNVAYLSQEVKFWVKQRMEKVKIGGNTYQIAFYKCNGEGPRPESYREDISTANMFTDDKDKQKIYKELRSAAQSGWDFSSRWIFGNDSSNKANLSFTETTRVAPVDLNSYLYGAFSNLAMFYSALGYEKKNRYWESKAKKLLTIIQNVFWNNNDGTWYDFDIKLKKQRRFFAASNLTPLWVNAYHEKNKQIKRIVQYLRSQGITSYPGGIPATKAYTGEQWDFPNSFPPLQSIIVQGLQKSGNAEAQSLARELAEKWVKANMIGEKVHGVMFEKYHAQYPGQHGHGGEYKVQKGFGWTKARSAREVFIPCDYLPWRLNNRAFMRADTYVSIRFINKRVDRALKIELGR